MRQSPDYLRISITSGCNLRCVYCHPGNGAQYSESLSADSVVRFVNLAAKCGIKKVRLTGGEPLTHPEIVDMVSRLSMIEGIEKLGLTTNGILLAGLADELLGAGLQAVNISVPSIRPEVFARITGGGNSADVLAGIEAALRCGIPSVKLNTVALRGINDEELPDIASIARSKPIEARFVEFMPFDDSPCVLNAKEVSLLVSGDEILERLRPLGEFRQLLSTNGAAAASYEIKGFKGRIGLIRSVTMPFCAGCRRVRLTSDGKLRACLVEGGEIDASDFLSGANSDPGSLKKIFAGCAAMKPEKHRGSFRGVMTCIGG